MTTPREQLEVFRSGAEQLVSEEELLAKLARGRPLRIKYGCDPSAPDRRPTGRFALAGARMSDMRPLGLLAL